MVRVRFAPSPTGSLHLGNALSAVANRRFADERGGVMLLRIDDTDAGRNVEGGEAAIVRDLEWLGVSWDEGPVRQSERKPVYEEAVSRLPAERDAAGATTYHGITLLRADASATYQLASVVDDLELGVTHVIRGSDHRANAALHARLARALGGRAPEYLHHGLVLAPGGGKLSKRDAISALADLREAGIPAEAARRYLDELGLPQHDVRLDLPRLRRLAIDAIAAMSDEALAERAGAPPQLVPALRGARDLNEARETARALLEFEPASLPAEAEPTLRRFLELRASANGSLDEEGARAVVRELKAVGGDLRSLRLALTGRERGPELWAVLAALPYDETVRRIDAAL